MTAFLLISVSIQFAYMKFGIADHTNWSIAMWASNYALIAACAYEEAEKELIKRIFLGRHFMRMIALMFGYFMFAELSYINTSYEVYRAGTKTDVLWYQLGFVLSAASLIIIMDLTKKRMIKNA